MKILITGATGLIGQHLGVELVRRGHQLTIITRQPKKALAECPFPCEIIEGDLGQKKINFSKNQNFDAVINLMGEPIASGLWTDSKKKRLVSSRVTATHHLVESLRENPPRVFISASAIGFYGDGGSRTLDEGAPAGPDFLGELCRDWEASALKIQSPRTRVVIPRIGIVISRQGGFLGEVQSLFQAGLAGPLGSGEQWMSTIHLNDLIKTFLFALENNAFSGVYNAVGPQPITNSQFTKTYGEILGRPTLFKAPAFVLKNIFREKAALLLFSQKVLPTRLLEAGFKFEYDTLTDSLKKEYPIQEKNEDIFQAYQYLPLKLEDLFPFFAEAKNLETITPAQLKFQIKSVSTETIQEGTLIEYSLSLHGIPFRWKTLIHEWNPPFKFVDEQLSGPYHLWHHTHSFERLGEGTLMSDRVRIRLPLGFLGWFFGHSFVKSEVQGIFNFRRHRIREIFKLN